MTPEIERDLVRFAYLVEGKLARLDAAIGRDQINLALELVVDVGRLAERYAADLRALGARDDDGEPT